MKVSDVLRQAKELYSSGECGTIGQAIHVAADGDGTLELRARGMAAKVRQGTLERMDKAIAIAEIVEALQKVNP